MPRSSEGETAGQSRGLPGRTNCRRYLSNQGSRHDDPAASLRTSGCRWLELAQEHRTNVSPMVPSMLQMLLQQPLEDYDLSALARLTSGSAPLPAQVAVDLRKRLPQVEIAEGYGCTETAGIISTSAIGQARAGSVGKPAPGAGVRIALADSSAVAPGRDGEICVRGRC